jgi:hypothetical protein
MLEEHEDYHTPAPIRLALQSMHPRPALQPGRGIQDSNRHLPLSRHALGPRAVVEFSTGGACESQRFSGQAIHRRHSVE